MKNRSVVFLPSIVSLEAVSLTYEIKDFISKSKNKNIKTTEIIRLALNHFALNPSDCAIVDSKNPVLAPIMIWEEDLEIIKSLRSINTGGIEAFHLIMSGLYLDLVVLEKDFGF